jgi:hypothetical protein
VEQPAPGNVNNGLHVTQEAIDVVRPGGSDTHTVMTKDANGQMGQVWVNIGSTDKAPAVQVDTKAAAKSTAKATAKADPKTK